MPELSVIAWLVLAAAVLAVAFVYSSVGHGGATGYLAVLALAGTWCGARRWTNRTFGRVLALVLVFAGGKLLWSAFV